MFMKKIFRVIILFFVLGIIVSNSVSKADDDFSRRDYNRAICGDKNLSGAKLEEANLQNVDLSYANLRGAELDESNLQGADLRNADLQDADLESANLMGAKIEGANFKNAELEFATWVDGRVCAEGSIGGCW